MLERTDVIPALFWCGSSVGCAACCKSPCVREGDAHVHRKIMKGHSEDCCSSSGAGWRSSCWHSTSAAALSLSLLVTIFCFHRLPLRACLGNEDQGRARVSE